MESGGTLEAAASTVIKACLANNVACAFPVLGGDAEVKKRLDQGFKVLLVAGQPAPRQ